MLGLVVVGAWWSDPAHASDCSAVLTAFYGANLGFGSDGGANRTLRPSNTAAAHQVFVEHPAPIGPATEHPQLTNPSHAERAAKRPRDQ